jgi:ADP-ribose pyrophosphatase YjhB (NUDIX family)
VISFRVDSHRFHLRAAAVALEAGHVLLHRLEGDMFWALPGGRVEAGEDGAQTIVREFKEELELTVRCHELLGIGENFFEYGGEPHHEVGLYFSVSLPAESQLRDTQRSHAGVEGERALEFKWFPLETLREIDFRPTALRESLAAGTVPLHFVQRGQAVENSTRRL